MDICIYDVTFKNEKSGLGFECNGQFFPANSSGAALRFCFVELTRKLIFILLQVTSTYIWRRDIRIQKTLQQLYSFIQPLKGFRQLNLGVVSCKIWFIAPLSKLETHFWYIGAFDVGPKGAIYGIGTLLRACHYTTISIVIDVEIM